MRTNQANYPIRVMAHVLGVSTSGFYAWRDRQPSGRQRSDAALLRRIRTIHAVSHGTYGAPRIYAELRVDGVRVGRKRVARLMRETGIAGVSRRRRTVTTTVPAPERPSAGDLVRRDFTADGPDRLWVADITFVPTAAGFLFLAVVLDAWSRRIVGWAFSHDLRTGLVLDALDMAVASRKPEDVIHHSDKGSQGGLNRSSHHSCIGGCDGCEETTVGSVRTEEVVVTGPAAGRDPRGHGPVLGGSFCGAIERGRGRGSGCIAAGGIEVVPEVRRHATNASCSFGVAAVGTVSVFRGARRDRASTGPGARRSPHLPNLESRAIDDLAGIAA